MSPYSNDTAARHDPPIEKTATEARQAETPGRMRYVLGISTVLSVAGLVVVYFIVFH